MALPWARLGASRWDGSVDTAGSCHLNTEITPGRDNACPRAPGVLWGGDTPGTRGHPGTLLLTAQTGSRAGGPQCPLQDRAAWQDRRLHLRRPCPHPWSLSMHPVPHSVPFGDRKGKTLSPTPAMPAASPATPQAGPMGAGQLPKSGAKPRPGPSGRVAGSEAAGGAQLVPPMSRGCQGWAGGHLTGALLVLNTPGTAAPAQPPTAPSHPLPLHPTFRDMPGKGPPGPCPGQRRAVTVTRGSLFIVTNHCN